MKKSPFAFLKRGGAILPVVAALWAGLAAAPASAQPTATVSISPSSIYEGSGGGTVNASFRVTLSAPPTQETKIDFTTLPADAAQGRTATPDVDFTVTTTTLVFEPNNGTGSYSQTVNVPIISDNTDEPNEVFGVQIAKNSSSTGLVNIQTDTATATILDDDDPPVLFVTGNQVLEGDTGAKNLVFTVSLVDPSDLTTPATSGSDVTFTYATLGQGQCVAGEDFTAVSGTGTISAGVSSTTISVPVLGDTVDEGDEQFLLQISNPTNAALGNTSAVGYIADDDGPIIHVVDAQVTEGGRAAFLINVYEPGTESNPVGSPQDITINYATSDRGGSTDAVAGSDYVATSGSVVVKAYETGVVIYVDTLDDGLYEGGSSGTPENFNFNILGATGSSNSEGITIDRGTAVGSIIDNESKPTLTVLDTVTPDLDNIVSSVKEGNAGTTSTLTFKAHLSVASERPVYFFYQTVNGSGTNIATAGSDYTAVSGTRVDFPKGTTDTSFNVSVIGDNTVENTETLQVKLYGNSSTCTFPSNATTLTVNGQIADDDGDPPVIDVTGPASSIAEGDSGSKSVIFTFKLSKVVDYPITINYATQDGSATAGNDYTAASGSKVIAAGLTSVDVPVTILGDTLYEGDETFSLAITGVSNGTIGNGSTTATIQDDDSVPTVKSVFVASNTEGTDATAGAFTAFPVTVTLDHASGSNITYNYQVVGDSSAKARATANDFLNPTGSITIPAGQTSSTAVLQVVPDNVNEGDEGFLVRITNPLTNNSLIRTGTGVITNDDPGGKISIAALKTGSDTAAETTDPAGSFLNYVVSLTPVNGTTAGQDVVVNYTVTGATAVPITPGGTTPDITSRVGTVTIPAGQTSAPLNIQIVDDKIAEKDEGLLVTITAVTTGWVADDTKNSAAGTIQDNDCSITKVDPAKGYPNLDQSNPYGVDGDGTDVTITGTGFQIGGVSVVQSIEFGVGNTIKTPVAVFPSGFDVTSSTSITVHVPPGAVTGNIRVTTTANSALSPKPFIVQPIVTSISPDKGVVPASTQVTLKGAYFKDPLNPVTNLKFGTTPIDPNSALGGSFTVVDKNTIVATLPNGVDPSVKVTVVTQYGGDGGASDDSITVASASNGSVTFGDAPDTTSVFENSFVSSLVTKTSPTVRNYPLSLSAAKTSTNVAVAPRGEVVVKVTIADDLPAVTTSRLRFPEIATPASRAEVKSGTEIDYTFPAGSLPSFLVCIVDSGDDYLKPNFVPTGPFMERAPDTKLTLKAEIIRSADPLYPVGANTSVSFNRIDPRGLIFPVGTSFRTDEDANSPNHTTRFTVGLFNQNKFNPDGTVNTEWVPRYDVRVPIKTSDPSEGLLSYYVRKPGSSTLIQIQPIPQAIQQVNFRLNPNDNEYYLNEHIIIVTGQDDKIQDGDVPYDILVGDATSTSQVFSADLEYQFTIPSSLLELVNGDNEQVEPTDPTDTSQPGFIFATATGTTTTPSITTSENGTTDFFTVRLRKQPTGKVTMRVKTSNPAEGMLVDPTTNQLVQSYDIVFTKNTPADPTNKKMTRYDTPITVTVQGVDDSIQDGNKAYLIVTNTIDSATVDTEYARIDPVDVNATNIDNESLGVTVNPSRLTISEGASDVFKVRLNKKPTANVVITVVSSDPTTATVTKNRLTFTPTTGQAVTPSTAPGTVNTTGGWDQAQPVRVSGVRDFIASNTPRNATIQLTLSSTDTAYNAIDPADVAVSVLDADAAGVTVTPAGIQTISENGGSKDLSFSLNSKPTADVAYTFTATPASALHFEVDGVAQDSVTLTFTPNNFNVAQTLHVVAIDNAVVNDPVSARVSSTVKTTDAAYNALATPFKRFTITDDETSGGGGGSGGTTIKTFAASTAYTISFPYMPGSGADSVGLPAQIFDRAMKTGDTVNYHLYSFKANTQNGALLPIGSETEFKIPSNNYVELDATTPLTRGRGYILVTGKSAVGLLAKGNGLVALANSSPSGDPLFSVALRTNPNFTGGAVRNGLNLIGFPFDPKQYSSVTLENCSVTVVSNGTPVTKTWAEAVGAGWINGDVFSVDPTTGHLTRLASDAHQVNALSAVFVQTYVDGAVLTLKSPAPAS